MTQVTFDTEFKIKATGKAFKVLSDGLYSDKITAILRELSCNAYESHAAVKNINPFEIHLPTYAELFYYIRDFGKGLSHKEVNEVYTTYFESTKEGSEDDAGFMGLGSKTPFCYFTKTFEITSWFEGVKTSYKAYLAPNGCPRCDMVDSVDSGEATGVMIKFPVQNYDVNYFWDKAAYALLPFASHVKFVGKKIDLIEPASVHTGSCWKLYDNNSHIVALMGNVRYPIDGNVLTNITTNHRAILNLPVQISFANKTLDVAASREGLSYDEITIERIKAKLDIVYDEMLKNFQDEFSKCKNLWQARLLYGKRKNNYKFEPFLKNVLFNGQSVVDTYLTIVDKVSLNMLPAYKAYDVTFTKARTKIVGTDSLHVQEGITFLIQDVNEKLKPRLFTHFNNIHHGKIILIQGSWDKFKTHVGMTDEKAVLVSSFPVPPKSVRISSGENIYSNLYELNLPFVSGAYGKDSWEISEIDLRSNDGVDETKYYVPIDRFKIDDTEAIEYFRKYETFLTNVGKPLSGLYIVGVKKSFVHKIINRNDWVPFDTFIKGEQEAYITSKNITQETINTISQYEEMPHEIKKALGHFDEVIGKFPATSVLSLCHAEVQKAKTLAETFKSEWSLLKTYFKVEKDYNAENIFSEMWNKVKEKYVLLYDVDLRYDSTKQKLKHVVKYIQTIENAEKN